MRSGVKHASNGLRWALRIRRRSDVKRATGRRSWGIRMKIQLVPLLVATFLLAGCAETINGKGLAEPQVAQFHERLKARDFEGIYEATGEEFKANASKELVLALFEAIDRKLGPIEQAKLINWSVNTRNFTTTVALVYDSKYRDGQATETFTFRVKDDTAELIAYNINSLDMLIK